MNAQPLRLPTILSGLALTLLVACGGGGAATSPAAGGGTTTGGGTGTGGGGTITTSGCPLPATLSTAIRTAISNGDALSGPTADDYIDATLTTLEAKRTAFDPLIAKLFNLEANGAAKADGSSLTDVSWDPKHDAALLTATFGVNTEVLIANQTAAGAPAESRGLAVAGETDTKSRYLVMATNPFRTNPARDNSSVVNAQMDRFMVNGIQWLTNKPAGSPLRVVLLHLDESTWFADESSTRTWLSTQFGSNVSFNAANACDGDALGSCLSSGADLIIVSQAYDSATQQSGKIVDSIKGAMDKGLPVLYLQQDGGLNALGSGLLDLFHVQYSGDNIWSKLKMTSLNGAGLMGRLSPSLTSIKEMLTRLKTGTYSFGLTTVWANATESAAFNTQFQAGANAVRNIMVANDQAKRDLFLTCGNEIPKLLALLGDRIRQDIVYPMSVDKTSTKDFLRAYYADHSVYMSRQKAPAQKNLGSFSSKDLSQVTPISKTVKMESCVPFRAAGVYALPGKTVKVTRVDSGNVAVRVFVNSLRSGSTHEWDNGGYTRPKYLRSTELSIGPGETITFTSPYGGPVQLSFGGNDVPVELRFENVGQHAYWASPADNQSFTQALATAQFDWAELATGSFEVHSKLDYIKTRTLTGTLWKTPETLAAATMKLDHGYTNLLAGFRGDGIDEVPEIHGWAAAKGYDVAVFDHIKHCNADQATCGVACSGNPFDRWGAFGPVHWGDLHEIGHGLQSGRMLVSTGKVQQGGHGATNFYAEYARERFFEDSGLHDSGDGLCNFAISPTGTMSSTPWPIFKALVTASSAADPGAAMEEMLENALTGTPVDTTDENPDADPVTATALAGMGESHNGFVFTQLQMQARKRGKLDIGHHIMARLHILERNFNAAMRDTATWDSKKAALGFGTLSYDQAKALKTNEWLVIAASWAVEIDFRSLLDMLGIRFGAVASDQVAAFKFPSTGRELILTNNANAAQFKDSRILKEAGTPVVIKTVAISPTAVWPW